MTDKIARAKINELVSMLNNLQVNYSQRHGLIVLNEIEPIPIDSKETGWEELTKTAQGLFPAKEAPDSKENPMGWAVCKKCHTAGKTLNGLCDYCLEKEAHDKIVIGQCPKCTHSIADCICTEAQDKIPISEKQAREMLYRDYITNSVIDELISEWKDEGYIQKGGE